MPDLPIISILMPVFNAQHFLKDCLDSILEQRAMNWELVAVNDYSTDKSEEILQQYAALDSRIKVMRNQSKGIIPALRLAYNHSSGEHITRMDADDKMTPEKLAQLQNTLLQMGPGHISTGLVKYFSDAEELGAGYQAYADWLNKLAIQQNHYSAIYKECVIPSPCWMVHRTDLDRCGAFEPETYPEDYDLCFRFYQHHIQPITVPTVLHYWRDHTGRTSRNDPKYADQHFFPLKLKYFLQLDYKPQQPLVLWGAGKKGKKLAQLLQEANITFFWVCNNEAKWGHHIYGIEMRPIAEVKTLQNPQIIITVAGPSDQIDIKQYIAAELPSCSPYFFA